MKKSSDFSGFKLYTSYEQAQECSNCLYMITTKDNVPEYIGKAKRFGGANGRYAHGYKYLIEILLDCGYRLFIKKLSNREWREIIEIEKKYIKKYNPIRNRNK